MTKPETSIDAEIRLYLEVEGLPNPMFAEEVEVQVYARQRRVERRLCQEQT